MIPALSPPRRTRRGHRPQLARALQTYPQPPRKTAQSCTSQRQRQPVRTSQTYPEHTEIKRLPKKFSSFRQKCGACSKPAAHAQNCTIMHKPASLRVPASHVAPSARSVRSVKNAERAQNPKLTHKTAQSTSLDCAQWQPVHIPQTHPEYSEIKRLKLNTVRSVRNAARARNPQATHKTAQSCTSRLSVSPSPCCPVSRSPLTARPIP